MTPYPGAPRGDDRSDGDRRSLQVGSSPRDRRGAEAFQQIVGTSIQISALAAAAATVVSSLLYTLCVWMRLRTERYRWEATTRLTDRHGPQILGEIPHVAPALRDADEGWAVPRLPRHRRPRADRRTSR
jgi:hypothetical protein